MDMTISDSILSQASSIEAEKRRRQLCNQASNRKAAFLGDGRNVTVAVQNPNDNDPAWMRQIIDRVLLMENHAKAGRKAGPRRAGKW
jgi:hypothetical protein